MPRSRLRKGQRSVATVALPCFCCLTVSAVQALTRRCLRADPGNTAHRQRHQSWRSPHCNAHAAARRPVQHPKGLDPKVLRDCTKFRYLEQHYSRMVTEHSLWCQVKDKGKP